MIKRQPLDLPLAVARAFVKDMRPTRSSGDENAVRQLNTLIELQGPHETKLRLSDVKAMFEQMRKIIS